MYDTNGNMREFEAGFNVSSAGYRSFPARAEVIPNAELIPAAPQDTRTVLPEAWRLLRFARFKHG